MPGRLSRRSHEPCTRRHHKVHLERPQKGRNHSTKATFSCWELGNCTRYSRHVHDIYIINHTRLSMVNSFTRLIGFLRVLSIIPVGCRGRSPGPEVSASHIRDSGACHSDWARKQDIQYNIILIWNLLWIFIWNLVVYISQTLQRNVSHLRKSCDLIKLCY